MEEGGVEAIFKDSRRNPYPKNRADEETELAVINSALEFPTHGQARTSDDFINRVFLSLAVVYVVSGSGIS